jgi:enterochelin esterase family protein
MLRFIALFFLLLASAFAQKHPLQQLIDAARADSPELKNLLGQGLPGLNGRDGVAVWGQDFLFAVESATPATVSIDKQPPIEMKAVAGTNYHYLLKTLRLGTTHQYLYLDAAGKPIGTYEVASYNPDSYPLPGVPQGKLSGKKTLTSQVYPGMTANYWVYVNPGADMTNGAPLMVWQDWRDHRRQPGPVAAAAADRIGQPGSQKIDSSDGPRAHPARHGTAANAQHPVRYRVGHVWKVFTRRDSAGR